MRPLSLLPPPLENPEDVAVPEEPLDDDGVDAVELVLTELVAGARSAGIGSRGRTCV